MRTLQQMTASVLGNGSVFAFCKHLLLQAVGTGHAQLHVSAMQPLLVSCCNPAAASQLLAVKR